MKRLRPPNTVRVSRHESWSLRDMDVRNLGRNVAKISILIKRGPWKRPAKPGRISRNLRRDLGGWDGRRETILAECSRRINISEKPPPDIRAGLTLPYKGLPPKRTSDIGGWAVLVGVGGCGGLA